MRMATIGVCRLCGDMNVELRNSHILPEFLYTPIYDEKSRALNISPHLGERDAPLQLGIREPLLCTKCEQHFSKNYEDYAARKIRHLPSTQHNKPGDIIYVSGVDYQKFKLFQISLLWRASVTSKREFSEVSLGGHEERLRLMLASNSPGEPWEYGCVLTGFSGEELNRFIKLPNRHRFEGHIAYSMVCAGLVWTYIVSSHTHRIAGQASFLQKSNVLPIHIVSTTAEQFSARIGEMLKGSQ